MAKSLEVIKFGQEQTDDANKICDIIPCAPSPGGCVDGAVSVCKAPVAGLKVGFTTLTTQ